jgi:hypothetical protein
MRLALSLVALLLVAAPARAEDPNVTAALEQSGQASAAEKLAFADAAVLEVKEAVTTAEELLARAEKEKDADAIECVTRKLIPLRALAGVAETSATGVRSALADNDNVHADQEYRKVAVALTKAREFLAEARACLGDLTGKSGNAVVSVDDGGLGPAPPLDSEGPIDIVPGSPI